MPSFGERATVLGLESGLIWTYSPLTLNGRSTLNSRWSPSSLPPEGVALQRGRLYSFPREFRLLGYTTPPTTRNLAGTFLVMTSTITRTGATFTGPPGAIRGVPYAGTLRFTTRDGSQTFDMTFGGNLDVWQPDEDEDFVQWRPGFLDVSAVPDTTTSYQGGTMQIIPTRPSDYSDPIAGPLWVEADARQDLLVEITGQGVDVEKAGLVTRYRSHSPVGRQLVWRGSQWLVESVSYPDRKRTMELGLKRTVDRKAG